MFALAIKTNATPTISAIIPDSKEANTISVCKNML